jgi:hypothetical protein
MVLFLFDGHGRDELQPVRSVGEPLSVEEFDARIGFLLVLRASSIAGEAPPGYERGPRARTARG